MAPHRKLTPLPAVTRGLIAGVIGTAAMTVAQELSARLQSSGGGGGGGAQEESADPWEQASAPAKVAKRIGEGVFQREVSSDLIPVLTRATHWGYGTGWGLVYGILAGSDERARSLPAGLVFGAGVWVMSYVQLVPMGLYELPWKYPVRDEAMELSYHLVYGAGASMGFRALTRG